MTKDSNNITRFAEYKISKLGKHPKAARQQKLKGNGGRNGWV